MSHTAYGLRAEYDGTVDLDGETVPIFRGGLLAVDGAPDFDVRAELDAGAGVIVVDDTNTALTFVLDEHPALKRVPAPEHRDAIGPYDGMNTDDLRAELRNRALPAGGRKDELVARLEADDAGDALLGDPDNTTPEA